MDGTRRGQHKPNQWAKLVEMAKIALLTFLSGAVIAVLLNAYVWQPYFLQQHRDLFQVQLGQCSAAPLTMGAFNDFYALQAQNPTVLRQVCHVVRVWVEACKPHANLGPAWQHLNDLCEPIVGLA